MTIVWALLILTCSVWITAVLVPGIKVRGFWDSLVVSIIFGIVNYLFGWFLFGVIGIATLGLGFLFYFLTRLVVSAFMLLLTSAMTKRLEVDGFGWALAGAFVIAVLSGILEWGLHRIPGLPGI